MMKNRIIYSFLVFFLLSPLTLFAGSSQKEVVGSTIVWAASEKMMLLVAAIAEDKGNYLTVIRSQHIKNKILE